jgi:4-amino-4-deoxy-L-arabinose transferase-like glycosyltransferase
MALKDSPHHPSAPWAGIRRGAHRVRIPLFLTSYLVITRLPLLLAPRALDDEQVYAVVARQVLAGGKLYIDAIERKPPLLFLVYEGILRVAGAGNWFALHLTAMLWTLATMAGLYLIARRVFGPSVGVWAALLYAAFQAWGDYRNLAFNGEVLMNLPIVLALALALGPSSSRSRPELLAAGALVAIAFLLKQPAGIAGLPLGLYVMHPGYRASRGTGWRHSLGHGLLLLVGFVMVLGGAAYLLRQDGNLQEALQWTILDHAAIPEGAWLRLVIHRAPKAVGFFVLSTLPLLIGAWQSVSAGIRGRLYWASHPAEFSAILLLLAVSLLGVTINGQFLYHYFLQLLPPLALLAAPAFSEAWAAQADSRLGLPGRPWLVRWLGASALVFLVVDVVGVARQSQPSVAATYVRDHSAASDRIFVWGQGTRQTGMYLDADRLSASRFIASFPLTGHVFGLGNPGVNALRVPPERWQELLADFVRHPPRFIIDTDGAGRPSRYPIAQYPVLHAYLKASYEEVYRAPDGVVYERLAGQ